MCTSRYNRNVLHTNVRELFDEIETKENGIVPSTKGILKIQKRKMFSFHPVLNAGKEGNIFMKHVVQRKRIRSFY